MNHQEQKTYQQGGMIRMKRTMMNKLIRRGFGLGLAGLALILIAAAATVANAAENSGNAGTTAAGNEVRDLRWFLQRMRTLDHLPELEPAVGHGSGTWNPTHRNMDITWFRGVKDDHTNVLIDTDGPGVLTRMCFNPPVPESRFQVFIDGEETPSFDIPARQLVTPGKSPIPGPLVFDFCWEGMFFPIPFAKHIRVQMFDPSGTPKKPTEEFDGAKYYGFHVPGWGRFFEWDYTVFPQNIPVKSLQWPLSAADAELVKKTAEAWRKATTERPPPDGSDLPRCGKTEQVLELPKGGRIPVELDRPGTIRRILLGSDQPEELLRVRMRAYWDDATEASVDVPVGYFFGCGDRGFGGHPYHSLFIGGDSDGVYANLPMPFRKKARLEFENQSEDHVTVYLSLLTDHTTPIPASHGYFHATWTETTLDREKTREIHSPRPQIKNPDARLILAGSGEEGTVRAPAYAYLKREGVRGKYVGLIAHNGWPYEGWWGEGDALIWTDQKAEVMEQEWPPRYHGTGAECYFNSGHCLFADRALSGVASKLKEKAKGWWFDRPGDSIVYSFHPLQEFQFANSITMAIEVDFSSYKYNNKLDDLIVYGGTAFWYADRPVAARSDPKIIWPRKVGPAWEALKTKEKQ